MDALIVIGVLAVVAIGLCIWIYTRVAQHSQALMHLGEDDRPISPYE